MGSTIYVGNLPYSFGDQELRDAFSSFGEITEATVIKDKYSGKSKGFGFVTFSEEGKTGKAIEDMNGKEVSGREIKVSEARPRQDSS